MHYTHTEFCCTALHMGHADNLTLMSTSSDQWLTHFHRDNEVSIGKWKDEFAMRGRLNSGRGGPLIRDGLFLSWNPQKNNAHLSRSVPELFMTRPDRYYIIMEFKKIRRHSDDNSLNIPIIKLLVGEVLMDKAPRRGKQSKQNVCGTNLHKAM